LKLELKCIVVRYGTEVVRVMPYSPTNGNITGIFAGLDAKLVVSHCLVSFVFLIWEWKEIGKTVGRSV